jgi:hypothetical protein
LTGLGELCASKVGIPYMKISAKLDWKLYKGVVNLPFIFSY